MAQNSNTVTVAKILEKAVIAQINSHILAHNLHTATQSGYKKGRSCETAVLKVINDVQNEIFKKMLQFFSCLIFLRASTQLSNLYSLEWFCWKIISLGCKLLKRT